VRGAEFGALQVACGAAHTAAIVVPKAEVEAAAKGKDGPQRALLTWGENQTGQLGYETQSDDARSEVPAPVPLKTSSPVQVSCGATHTAALDDTGEVWVWGAADCMPRSALRRKHSTSSNPSKSIFGGLRALGRKDTPPDPLNEKDGDQYAPVKVDWNQVPGFPVGCQMASVAAGKESTLVCTSAGQLYHWGNGKWAMSKNPKLVTSGQLEGHEVSAVITSHAAEHAVALVQGYTGDFRECR